MSETTEQLYDMAGAMLKLGNQFDPNGLAAFVRDYPDLAEPAHLRERAWALSVKWLDELPTKTRARQERAK